MTYTTIIIAAAKAAKVSSALMLAICTHESGLTNALVLHDGGSPTFGICMIKQSTAEMVGFKGPVGDLMNPAINAKYSALYLKYQVDRYGSDDWVKLASAYNAGSYTESKKAPGCPRNLKYVKLVQKQLDKGFHFRMECRK